jgi:hypothetical protein
MPALKPTDFVARIVWLGVSPNPEGAGDIRSVPRQTLPLDWGGPAGEIRHRGRARASCSRVVAQHPKGTEIANVRQLSIVSAEELRQIAEASGLDAIDPTWLGATIVVDGIPDFTLVPPSSRLQARDGATLVVDMENRPYHLPAQIIEKDAPGHGKSFKSAAKGRRGVTAWVEREGCLRIGEQLTLHVPDQPAWPHLKADPD